MVREWGGVMGLKGVELWRDGGEGLWGLKKDGVKGIEGEEYVGKRMAINKITWLAITLEGWWGECGGMGFKKG